MRAVCFVERQEIDFPGSVFKNALALGDVDGDGESELVVGNEAGDLAVFKNSSGNRPWFRTSGLRMITAVGVGELIEPGRNTLVVVSGDGWCHILLPGAAPSCPSDVPQGPDNTMHVAHVQRIPPNTHCLVLGDMDGDGRTELVLGLTDRVVRSYRWLPDPPPAAKGQGRLVSLHKWEAASQVGSVSIGREKGGKPSLLVSQPGGTFLRITFKQGEPQQEDKQGEQENNEEQGGETQIEYHPLSSSRMRNPNVSTEIVGDVETGEDPSKGSPYAVATIDGTLMLVKDENIIWSIQLHRQLFSMTRLDMTGDNKDEIVVCSWDGQTYILGQDQVSVRFQFEDSVAAFCAGRFGRANTNTSLPPPCLVYCTFSNKIYVYTDLNISKLRASSMENKMGQVYPELTKRDRQKLVQWCLYGPQNST